MKEKLTIHHPLEFLRKENEALLDLVAETASLTEDPDARAGQAAEHLRALRDVKAHYAKIEELLLPVLDQNGRGMQAADIWDGNDRIFHTLGRLASSTDEASWDDARRQRIRDLLEDIRKTAEREETVFRFCMDHMDEAAWLAVYRDFPELGCSFLPSLPVWPEGDARLERTKNNGMELPDAPVTLPQGTFTLKQLAAVLDLLPIDLTFIDAEDRVRFFTEKTGVFARPLSALGRPVMQCHPPRVRPVVEGMLLQFRSGEADHMEMWIPRKEDPVYVRYQAVYDEAGKYIGTLEMVQCFGSYLPHLTGQKPKQKMPEAEPDRDGEGW